jgi:hypothetical protein
MSASLKTLLLGQPPCRGRVAPEGHHWAYGFGVLYCMACGLQPVEPVAPAVADDEPDGV